MAAERGFGGRRGADVGAGPESADARKTVVLVAVVRGAVALKPVFMQWRRAWRVPFAVREGLLGGLGGGGMGWGLAYKSRIGWG